jgi:hypothetical protein
VGLVGRIGMQYDDVYFGYWFALAVYRISNSECSVKKIKLKLIAFYALECTQTFRQIADISNETDLKKLSKSNF